MQSGLWISAESAPFLPIERRVRSRDQPMDPSTAATPAPRPGALVLSVAPGLLLAAAGAVSADRGGGGVRGSAGGGMGGEPLAVLARAAGGDRAAGHRAADRHRAPRSGCAATI